MKYKILIMHKGERVALTIKRLGVKKSKIIDKLGIANSTIYTWLSDPDMSWENIRKVGLAINYDFEIDFPDYPKTTLAKNNELENIALEDVNILNEYDLKKKYIKMKDKYVTLLEEHLLLLRKNEGK